MLLPAEIDDGLKLHGSIQGIEPLVFAPSPLLKSSDVLQEYGGAIAQEIGGWLCHSLGDMFRRDLL